MSTFTTGSSVWGVDANVHHDMKGKNYSKVAEVRTENVDLV